MSQLKNLAASNTATFQDRFDMSQLKNLAASNTACAANTVPVTPCPPGVVLCESHFTQYVFAGKNEKNGTEKSSIVFTII
ncbi:hypothetical protein DPMN_180278 [Dreissena polymorpha]|uniref:Uncharacterized protein n=1 Tax=Dreissena polymorpha TaxID=45954 RepID=A0A9D4IN43_DREPO|nr:hypothetical protein DPMN_180278 [Dreissena polymorpha]